MLGQEYGCSPDGCSDSWDGNYSVIPGMGVLVNQYLRVAAGAGGAAGGGGTNAACMRWEFHRARDEHETLCERLRRNLEHVVLREMSRFPSGRGRRSGHEARGAGM
jgi:hypothetical protein